MVFQSREGARVVLLEAGFEYVSDYEGRKVLRKRK